MENLVSSVFGGEFQRHFWTGLLATLLLVSVLGLNGVTFPDYLPTDVLSLAALAIPSAVLLGVILDLLGHIFVLSSVARREALSSLEMAPVVLAMLHRQLKTANSSPQPPSLDTLAEYCFSLRASSASVVAHKKYEEQFSYFEFNRSVTLFFMPCLVYLLVLSLFHSLKDQVGLLEGLVSAIIYVLAQTLVFWLAWVTFHRHGGPGYRAGRRYFQPVFSVYSVVVTLQLGILFDYFTQLSLGQSDPNR